MIEINEILTIDKDFGMLLQKKGLDHSFLIAKEKLLSGNYAKLDLKKRQPKSKNIWSFRLNRKRRIIGVIRNNTFIIAKLDDHQE